MRTVEEVVDEMYIDLYKGKDKNNPSITTRLALIEEILDKLSKNLNKALVLAAGALVTVIGEIIVKSLFK